MQLSELLERNVLNTNVGNILNRFKIKHRRIVLFFEDILANYIRECENAGYEKEMKEIGQKWCVLTTKQLVPEVLKKLPLSIFFLFLKKMWINMGLMDNLNIVKNKNIIKIETKNEGVTRIIGRNNTMLGFYTGVLNIFFKSQIECIESLQTKKYCNYVFTIENRPLEIYHCKTKKIYNKLNFLPNIEGLTLKDALKKRIFYLKENNKIYFRKKPIVTVENTGFHIVSNKDILLEKVPLISYKYFKEFIKEKTTKEKKLTLLKNLLQIMGWGFVNIIFNNKYIIIEIKNPPYGLQLEKDNWNFLVQTIVGYLWLLDKNFKIINIEKNYKKLTIKFSN